MDKPGVTLVGTSASSTVITWNESWVAADSPTVSVLAPDFIAKRLTFQVRVCMHGLNRCYVPELLAAATSICL